MPETGTPRDAVRHYVYNAFEAAKKQRIRHE